MKKKNYEQLSNTESWRKWSFQGRDPQLVTQCQVALKSYTYKKHCTDLTGCTYVFRKTHTLKISTAERIPETESLVVASP